MFHFKFDQLSRSRISQKVTVVGSAIHDAPSLNVPGNFPLPLSFDYHVQFEDVCISIEHAH